MPGPTPVVLAVCAPLSTLPDPAVTELVAMPMLVPGGPPMPPPVPPETMLLPPGPEPAFTPSGVAGRQSSSARTSRRSSSSRRTRSRTTKLPILQMTTVFVNHLKSNMRIIDIDVNSYRLLKRSFSGNSGMNVSVFGTCSLNK